MTQYIFVTGGVLSSVGKGIFSASLGAVLEARGIDLNLIKLDPYLNVDPGTMNPLEHGEVFVTQDGIETDLDLGHYERFVNITMTKNNNFTAGQVYARLIKKERRGDYLGKTVQVVPHVTDEIKHLIKRSSKNHEVSIVEIGGTVGDIESLPFLEAIRQMRVELGYKNTIFVHVTYVPYIRAANEIKTKPTQHSAKELRTIGIQPDILICRSERKINNYEREKIALHTNVTKESVISLRDVKSIYSVPIMLHEQALDQVVADHLGIEVPQTKLEIWHNIIDAQKRPERSLEIAIVGKYVSWSDAYKSLHESLVHAGIHTRTKINIKYVDSEIVEQEGTEPLENVDAILVPGGFGNRGVLGKMIAIQYARENKIPFLGICLGLQLAVVEFARNVGEEKKANSTEFDKETDFPIVSLLEEWVTDEGKRITESHKKLGATMRLGSKKCKLKEGSLANIIYHKKIISERHRHRYEINSQLITKLEKLGLIVSGRSIDGTLVEMIEIDHHPWFVGCQFHPEFISNPRHGHPLFISFVKAGIKHSGKD